MNKPLQTSVWLLLSLPWPAQAHSGGLDARGCHHNRKSGDYHCHRQPQSAAYRANTNIPPTGFDARPTPARDAGGDGRTFTNCTQARAAGAAPVRRGQPGYGTHLDRDNDGVGCE